MATDRQIMQNALGYAKKGIPVFPCVRETKHPYTKLGFKEATTDLNQIIRWWGDHPGASIGMPTGPASGKWVLDVDEPGGSESLSALENEYEKLPDTLMQITGGGGCQLFWIWPTDRIIRNSASKIGPRLDVRGDGGYVILPPSGHPSGKWYGWVGKHPLIAAPEWLLFLVESKPETSLQQAQNLLPNSNGKSSYANKAFASELVSLTSAPLHTRNVTLNASAFNLGQFVGAGLLDKGHVETALLASAVGIGLEEKEARATIASGLSGGILKPREFSFLEDNLEVATVGDDPCKQEALDVSLDDDKKAYVSNVSSCKQMLAGCKQDVSTCKQEPVNRKPNSLAVAIEEWVINSVGCFTVEQLDREFCLTTRGQKNNRSVILTRLVLYNKIKRDKKKKGMYYVTDTHVEWLDLDAEVERAFPIILPFGLHEKVLIPPHSIIVLAGSSNAGKTALILNTIHINLHQEYQIDYYMSEMGGSEYKSRIKWFDRPMSDWKKVRVASKSYDFDAAIQHFNPDGLSCVDYLEEIEGEYFKIPSSIRAIYDSLNNGVAMICIQKKSGSEYARGGEATGEKARLYMALDNIAVLPDSIVCALKIIKAKHFIGTNINRHELHFKIENGFKLTTLGAWQNSATVNREAVARKLEAGDEDPDFYVRTMGNVQKRITINQIEKWQAKFQNINVFKEMQRISEDSYLRDFIKDGTGFFFQVAGILNKKNDEATSRLNTDGGEKRLWAD